MRSLQLLIDYIGEYDLFHDESGDHLTGHMSLRNAWPFLEDPSISSSLGNPASEYVHVPSK